MFGLVVAFEVTRELLVGHWARIASRDLGSAFTGHYSHCLLTVWSCGLGIFPYHAGDYHFSATAAAKLKQRHFICRVRGDVVEVLSPAEAD